MKRKRAAMLLAAASAALGASSALAGNVYWDGTTGTTWSDLTNWTTDPDVAATDPVDVPGAADDVVFNFNGTVGNAIATLGANQSAQGITFLNNVTSPITLGTLNDFTLSVGANGINVNTGASAVTINSGISLAAAQKWTNNSANLFTVAGNVGLGANTLTVAGTGNTTLSGTVSGTAGVTMGGDGVLTLSGTNTYAGMTTINSGVVAISSQANLGSGAAGNGIAFGSNSATLRWTGGTADNLGTNRTIAIANNGTATINVTGAGALTVPGVISGAAGTTLNVTGSTGRVILLPSNTNTGNASLAANVSVNGGVVLQVGNTAGTQYFNALGNATNRTVTVSGGSTIEFIGRDTTGNGGAPAFVVDGGTIKNTGGFNRLGTITLNGGTISTSAGNSTTYQALTLQGDVTVSGSSTNASVISTTGTNANIHLEKTGGVTFTVNDVTGNANADLIVNGVLMDKTNNAGSNSLTKTGAGTMFINAVQAYTGGTIINQGMVDLGGSGQIKNVTINNGGTLRISAGTDALAGNAAVTINAGGTWTYGSTAETIGALSGAGLLDKNNNTNGATLTLNADGSSSTFSGIIQNTQGTLAITKGGAGMLTLTGANTYNGNTSIPTGSLNVSGASGALLNSPTITVGDANGSDEYAIFGANADVVSGTLNRINDSATLGFNLSNTNGVTFNGPAAGSGGFTETIGTLALTLGRGNLTLNPASGQTLQLTTGALTRSNNSTLLIRGTGLGGSGADTSRLVVTGTQPTMLGAGGAAGSTTMSIVPYILGDTSASGAGASFITVDAVNGLRPLSNSEYASSIASAPLLANVSTSGENVSANATINSLRALGGTTTINSRVTVNSGAVLLTSGATLDGSGRIDFGTQEGVLFNAANTATTATINTRLAGTGGLTFSSSGNGTNVFLLGGENTALGNLVINQLTTVKLASAGALNDNYPMTVIPRGGGALQINGINATVRDLQSAGNAGTFQNGATSAATLTTYLTTNQTLNTNLQNGGTGALNLAVSGGASTLSLVVGNTYSGTTEVRTGTLILSSTSTSSHGTATNVTAFNLTGGTLRLTNSGNNSSARIGDSATVNMYGGVFDFDNGANAGNNFAETVGALNVLAGANSVTVDKAAGTNTSALTFASLSRTTGGVLNLTSQNNGTAIYDLGTTAQSRLVFTAPPTLDDGIIGGWATIDSSASTREFVKYVASGTISATALVAADYTAALASGANTTQNVKITATPAALTSDTQINSLNIAQASATTVDIGAGNTLRVESGGIIVSGGSNASFINGNLTAGTGSNGGDLIFHVVSPVANPVTVSSTITDNGASVVNLVKAGSGALTLGSSNTYSGRTFLNGGLTTISADGALGAAPSSAVADSLVLSNGSTLALTGSLTLNANRGITVGAGNNIISIPSVGTASAGIVLTYNGAISQLGTTEGSLQIKGNVGPAAGSLRPGSISATLSSLNLGGTFQLDAGTVNVTGANTVIGRGLKLGDGKPTLNFTAAGGSLTIGKGINSTDTLDVGIQYTDTGSTNLAHTTLGTLNLSALSNFTANLDTVRVGIASSSNEATGNVTLAANNDITAGTSFAIGGSGNSGNNSGTSLVTAGSTLTNITTKTMTVGGYKSNGQFVLPSASVVNLNGFGANTMDLLVASNSGNTGTVAQGTVNASLGTLNANLRNFNIGEKTGGGAGGATGTFTMGTNGGAVTATSMVIARVDGDSSTTTTATRGNLNLGGGSITVAGDVAMATWSNNTTFNPTSTGFLNITGGTFTVGGNITRTTANETLSNSYINVAGGVLDLQASALGDTTPGSITASQLAYRSGTIQDVAGATLTATTSTSAGASGTTGDALVVRDVAIGFGVTLTGATGGNVHYESAGAGSGATMQALNLGSVSRTINVENSAAAVHDLTIAGNVTGSAGITKTGAGTLRLAGSANAYTGTTTVSNGTLIVDGTHTGGGAYTVASAARLGGGGTIGSTVTVSDGATIGAGGGANGLVDKLTLAGLVLGGANSVSEFDLLGAATAGVDYDQLVLSGTTATTLAGSLRVNPSYFGQPNDQFVLMKYSNPTGTFSNVFANINGALLVDQGGGVYTATDSNGVGYQLTVGATQPDNSQSVVLSLTTAVPEPGTLGLIGAVAMGLLGRRRRRKV